MDFLFLGPKASKTKELLRFILDELKREWKLKMYVLKLQYKAQIEMTMSLWRWICQWVQTRQLNYFSVAWIIIFKQKLIFTTVCTAYLVQYTLLVFIGFFFSHFLPLFHSLNFLQRQNFINSAVLYLQKDTNSCPCRRL